MKWWIENLFSASRDLIYFDKNVFWMIFIFMFIFFFASFSEGVKKVWLYTYQKIRILNWLVYRRSRGNNLLHSNFSTEKFSWWRDTQAHKIHKNLEKCGEMLELLWFCESLWFSYIACHWHCDTNLMNAYNFYHRTHKIRFYLSIVETRHASKMDGDIKIHLLLLSLVLSQLSC